jgi:hypothetical protein
VTLYEIRTRSGERVAQYGRTPREAVCLHVPASADGMRHMREILVLPVGGEIAGWWAVFFQEEPWGFIRRMRGQVQR